MHLLSCAGGPVCEKLDKRLIPTSSEKIFSQETERPFRDLYALAGRAPEQWR